MKGIVLKYECYEIIYFPCGTTYYDYLYLSYVHLDKLLSLLQHQYLQYGNGLLLIVLQYQRSLDLLINR